MVALEHGETVAELTDIIKENRYFMEDVEFVKELIQSTIEAGEIRLRVLELELARLPTGIKSENERTGEGCDLLDALVKSVRILMVKVPNRPEGWTFLFTSLERAFASKKVLEKFKSEI
ncbi:hypothetical protein TNCT_313771 [Trichonephila clavata]|uniref:Uncharacterized protein n=1 Tax=Trichonephila clavata TaxID=2740835 RepID=A0A8X6L7S7_TRICU|nr:hypothetical protein TNCT_313771 [Trichonephila clavata]